MSPQDADQDMWKTYGVKLYNTLMSGQSLSPNQRFFLAPLSSAGIAASVTGLIPQAITNQGIFNVANTLLALDSPCYIPTVGSYVDRCEVLLNSVFLDPKGDIGLQAKLAMAQAASTQAQLQFQKTKTAAQAEWAKDKESGFTTQDFFTWVIQNNPQFGTDQQAMSSAAANVGTISNQIAGPAAAIVGKYTGKLNNVNLGAAGFTMDCSSAPASWVKAVVSGTPQPPPAPPLHLAAYDIDSQYNQDVDGWIKTFDEKVKNPQTITFTGSDFASSSWSQLGFSQSNVNVSAPVFCFFTASYTQNNQTVSKKMSLQEIGSSFKITVSFTHMKAYKIRPSASWNPAELFDLPVQNNAPHGLFQPMATVSQVFMAYGCGLSIEMDSNAFSEIQSHLQQVSSSGGSATLFGFNIGIGGGGSSASSSTTTADDVLKSSSGTSITIPPDNNGFPTLLGCIGTALPVPKKGN